MEIKWYVKYIQILPALAEGATESIVKGLHQKVFIRRNSAQCKISRTSKFHFFKIPDNKNNGKMFSKNELLFLHQANSSSDPSQILILQFFIPRVSLPTLAYFNAIFIIFFINFPILFYPIRPQATTSIGHQSKAKNNCEEELCFSLGFLIFKYSQALQTSSQI